MPPRLYFLTHQDNPELFSGHGIPLEEGTKSPLVGCYSWTGRKRVPPGYLDRIYETFGDYQIGPMTSKGDRGLYAQMRTEDPLSLSLLRDDLYNSVAGMMADVLDKSLSAGLLPRIRGSRLDGRQRTDCGSASLIFKEVIRNETKTKNSKRLVGQKPHPDPKNKPKDLSFTISIEIKLPENQGGGKAKSKRKGKVRVPVDVRVSGPET